MSLRVIMQGGLGMEVLVTEPAAIVRGLGQDSGGGNAVLDEGLFT